MSPSAGLRRLEDLSSFFAELPAIAPSIPACQVTISALFVYGSKKSRNSQSPKKQDTKSQYADQQLASRMPIQAQDRRY